MNASVHNNRSHKGAGHRQRLRQRFLDSGLQGFADYEVIELLLTLGTPRKDCKEAAKEALARFKTLQGVFEASTQSLAEIKGLGPNNVIGIKLIKEVCDRFLEHKVKDTDPLNNSKALYDYLSHRMGYKHRERFYGVFLDSKNRVNDIKLMFEGTLTQSSVYPREVVKAALENHAAAVIFAHNHPSGDPTPSTHDVAITRKLVFALKLMGIMVHEHIVIGKDNYFSFADHGYIAKFNKEYESNHVH